jgi:hypothetical protein
MRFVSEERLKEMLNDQEDGRHHEKEFIEFLLDQECKDLNEWQPIDEYTPKDRKIMIYDDSYGHAAVSWNNFYNYFTDDHGHKYMQPTHWQKLPEDPK